MMCERCKKARPKATPKAPPPNLPRMPEVKRCQRCDLDMRCRKVRYAAFTVNAEVDNGEMIAQDDELDYWECLECHDKEVIREAHTQNFAIGTPEESPRNLACSCLVCKEPIGVQQRAVLAQTPIEPDELNVIQEAKASFVDPAGNWWVCLKCHNRNVHSSATTARNLLTPLATNELTSKRRPEHCFNCGKQSTMVVLLKAGSDGDIPRDEWWQCSNCHHQRLFAFQTPQRTSVVTTIPDGTVPTYNPHDPSCWACGSPDSMKCEDQWTNKGTTLPAYDIEKWV